MALERWEQKLLEERSELKERMSVLIRFLSTEVGTNKEYNDLLYEQLVYMQRYYDVLTRRATYIDISIAKEQ